MTRGTGLLEPFLARLRARQANLLLGWNFGRAGFAMERIRFGYFEVRLNMWAMAER